MAHGHEELEIFLVTQASVACTVQRLYKEKYEKSKAKNHIPPDMLEILSARNTQSTVSGIHYRKYLHQWMCMPDMQMYVQARKVNEQLSDVSDRHTARERQISGSLASLSRKR